jgi:phosphopantetheine--protein transferase-like protein
MAHDGSLVVLAFDPCADLVGVDVVDVAKHDDVDFSDLRDAFTPAEWKDIVESVSPSRKFSMYWAAKESYVKALGVGLSQELCDIKIVFTGDLCHSVDAIAELASDTSINVALTYQANYVISVASNSPLQVVTTKLNLGDILTHY